ncbi:HAMP domain-containing sensor histidine kinase [Phenylobacterium sp.]|uniref:sensor histidine kinase n=1 Tax=Phenylobacterium sp. TaxID=1871053 RepID=UPI00286C7A64|nr:HAMP domain-containing sensor histidine kinase [Phenylobacterium sp.]
MADALLPQPPNRSSGRRFFWPGGLSARLLILTVLFVAGAGAMAVPAALAAFEEQWLLDRVRAAELASLATDVDPDQVMSEALSSKLRAGAGVQTVAILDNEGNRFLKVPGPRLARPPYLVDLRDRALGSWLSAPFQTLSGGEEGRMVRVIAEPRFYDAQFIEVVAPDAALKAELKRYLWRLLAVMAFVSAFAGGLVYLSLNVFLVRPMQRITRSMERFAADPEDMASRVEPSGRRDEIGRAEVELDRMQGELRTALASRARLAALGEAVAKINHDLRNMLTSAQIASERLAALKDPKVTQALPRLERALDRAVTLATDVLTYGKTQEAAPDVRPMLLAQALEIAAEEARFSDERMRLISGVDPADQVNADPDQLHRILVNLLRNAREAVEQQEGRTTPGQVQVSLAQEDGASLIYLADNGPGVSERARERLFQPFAGSTRPGGAGLGLAIARELAVGHGGDLALAQTGAEGSVFELRLPGAPPRLKAPRRRAKNPET